MTQNNRSSEDHALLLLLLLLIYICGINRGQILRTLIYSKSYFFISSKSESTEIFPLQIKNGIISVESIRNF